MKRTILYLLAATLVFAATPVQAEEPQDEPSESPGEDYEYWPATDQWCRLAYVAGPNIQVVLNPLLGVLAVDPDDCYIVVVEYLYSKITYYVDVE